MKLGDLAHCRTEHGVRPRLVPNTRGPNPGTVVFFPGCWIELLLLCTERYKRALETVLQQWKTGMCMLSFTSAWEDTFCMTELRVVAV